MGKPKSRRARRQEDQQRGRSDHELVDAGGVRPSSKPKPVGCHDSNTGAA